MKASSILTLLVLAAPYVVMGQTTVSARAGENILLLEVYNRSSAPLQNLHVRFAESPFDWFAPRGDARGNLPAYRDESFLRKGRIQLRLPFEVVQPTYNTTPVKIDVLNEDALIGTFDVVLSFADRPPYSTSSRAGGYEELHGKMNDLDEQSNAVPDAFALRQNYPNPFNPTTTIRFDLPVASFVSLKLYDLLGQEVRTLVNGDRTAGFHTVSWDGRNELGSAVPSGIYLYRIVTSNFVQTQRMTLIR